MSGNLPPGTTQRHIDEASPDYWRVWVWCDECGGRGIKPGYRSLMCEACRGNGGWHEDVR